MEESKFEEFKEPPKVSVTGVKGVGQGVMGMRKLAETGHTEPEEDLFSLQWEDLAEFVRKNNIKHHHLCL